MGKRTEEMLEKAIDLHSKGWTRTNIAKECGVSPQYVGKLLKIHEQNQNGPPERNYGLSTRVLNCLKRNRIPVDAHVIADSIDLLLGMRGLGEGSLSEIGMMLKALNIIHDINDWIEEGKQKRYNQSKTIFREYSYNLPRGQHMPQIDI
jgi:DNA-directed RNA polymerase alpha subunit